MTTRSTMLLTMLAWGAAPALSAQRDSVARRQDGTLPVATPTLGISGQRTFRRVTVHYGKWLTAGAAGTLIGFASREHQKSRRAWNALLDVCRSDNDACRIGADGHYVRSDAEELYQRSLMFDRRANHRLLGAQLSLVATAALFLFDLRAGRNGPDNIPFSGMRLTVEPTVDGAVMGMRIAF